MANELGRRQRKKLETRDRIVECAVSLFATQGYESTTMEDIGECADVARATVFNYFARKEDLVLAWFDRRRAELAESMAEGSEQVRGTPDRLRHALRTIARLFEADPTIGRAMVRAWLLAGGPLLSAESETSQMFATAIRSGQETGDIRPDLDADRAGRVVFDAYLGALYRWMSDEEGRYTLEEELVATLDLLLAGIARPSSSRRARKRSGGQLHGDDPTAAPAIAPRT